MSHGHQTSQGQGDHPPQYMSPPPTHHPGLASYPGLVPPPSHSIGHAYATPSVAGVQEILNLAAASSRDHPAFPGLPSPHILQAAQVQQQAHQAQQQAQQLAQQQAAQQAAQQQQQAAQQAAQVAQQAQQAAQAALQRQQQLQSQQQAAQHQLSQHITQRTKTEGLVNFDSVQQQPLELDLRQVVQQAQAQAAQHAAQQAASQHQQQQHHISSASQQQYVSQQQQQPQQVQQVSQQLQQQAQHQEQQKMQPAAVRSGPVPLLQQRMEQNPQAPLTAPPSAAANPPDLPLPPKILNIKKEHPSDDMQMNTHDTPQENAWLSTTNGPSHPVAVQPPPIPVVQPTGPPSDAEFEMLQTRLQSMDPIVVWNLVRIKILPNFTPWDFICDRTRLCGNKYGQTDPNNLTSGNKLPSSVAKLKFLLQEMNDLAEELSHLVDNCCETINDTEPEDDSEVPDGVDDIEEDEEELSENDAKPSVEDKAQDDEEKTDEQNDKKDKEAEKDDDQSKAKEDAEKSPKTVDPEPINTESEAKPDATDSIDAAPTTNGDVNASENSTDSTIDASTKEASNAPAENSVETTNQINEENEPMEEENKENDTPKINKKIKQEKGESNATDDLFMVLVEPKVKQLLGRPLLNKLKPKELKLMGRQYHTLFDEYDGPPMNIKLESEPLEVECNPFNFSSGGPTGKKRRKKKDKEKKQRGPPYKCQICTKVFVNRNRFNYHQKKRGACPGVPVAPKPHKYIGNRYYCIHKDCLPEGVELNVDIHPQYTNRTQYWRHFMEVHGKSVEFKYTCQYCNEVFPLKEMFDYHIKSKHERSHTCGYCGNRFPERRTLVKHERCHTGEKPYACDSCDFRCSSSSSLCQHKRRRHDPTESGRKHICEQCGKGFYTRDNLKEHIATHSNAKMFSCYICGKGLKNDSCYRRHMVCVHGLKHTCELCGKDFSSPIGLKHHQRGAHGIMF